MVHAVLSILTNGNNFPFPPSYWIDNRYSMFYAKCSKLLIFVQYNLFVELPRGESLSFPSFRAVVEFEFYYSFLVCVLQWSIHKLKFLILYFV